jgi:hypothetical protein
MSGIRYQRPWLDGGKDHVTAAGPVVSEPGGAAVRRRTARGVRQLNLKCRPASVIVSKARRTGSESAR